MRDLGHSHDPEVQAQLDRLGALALASGRIDLATITALMERLGNPQDRLPPVFHVAGTNGKGSVCAFLRACLEAQGYRVHVSTSPHLVRYNERIRLAGELISDRALAAGLEQVWEAAQGLSPSFFEATIAATFCAFARVPGDACVIEVGLGGRLDATNILKPDVLAAGVITSLGIDHEKFLLAPEADADAPQAPLARIAWEKAHIMRRACPVVTGFQPKAARSEILKLAQLHGAQPQLRGRDWFAEMGAKIDYRDAQGDLALPLPTLAGAHQAENAVLAVASLRSQSRIHVSERALAAGIRAAQWPARLQRLKQGPLTKLAGGRSIWLDGGHNRAAGDALAAHFAGENLHLIIGMLKAKDPAALIAPLRGSIRSITAVPIEGYDCHLPPAFATQAFGIQTFGIQARGAESIEAALLQIPSDDPSDSAPVLIAGSLYLAGEVLKANQEAVD